MLLIIFIQNKATMVKSVVILLIGILTLNACQEVTFTEPQPVDSEKLDAFPTQIQGKYRSKSDDAILVIDSKKMVRKYASDEKMLKSDLDSTWQIKGNEIYDAEDNKIGTVEFINNDSIWAHFRSEEIIFNKGEEQQLRKFKGYIFLNTKTDNGGWHVQQLSSRMRKISLRVITSSEMLDELQVEKVYSDENDEEGQYAPSKKEFKKIVRKRGFFWEEEFVKMK